MTTRAREDVESLLNELRDLLTRAGVQESQINVATGFNYRIDHFVKAYDWLHVFSMSPQVKEFRRVFELRPVEAWDNYALIGVTGLFEQNQLELAGYKLKQRWSLKRPRMFGPNRKVEDNAENEGREPSEHSNYLE